MIIFMPIQNQHIKNSSLFHYAFFMNLIFKNKGKKLEERLFSSILLISVLAIILFTLHAIIVLKGTPIKVVINDSIQNIKERDLDYFLLKPT